MLVLHPHAWCHHVDRKAVLEWLRSWWVGNPVPDTAGLLNPDRAILANFWPSVYNTKFEDKWVDTHRKKNVKTSSYGFGQYTNDRNQRCT